MIRLAILGAGILTFSAVSDVPGMLVCLLGGAFVLWSSNDQHKGVGVFSKIP